MSGVSGVLLGLTTGDFDPRSDLVEVRVYLSTHTTPVPTPDQYPSGRITESV